MLIALLIGGFGMGFAQSPDLSKVSLRLTDWIYKYENSQTRQAVGVKLVSGVDIKALDQELYARKALPAQRSAVIIQALQADARKTQPQFINWLRLVPGVDLAEMQQFWAGNVIFFEATSNAIKAISLQPGVEFIDIDAEGAFDEPVEMKASPSNKGKTVNGHEPGHDAIDAPTMWSMGYTGYGRLAMGIDTGVDPTHPSLQDRYQGNFKPANQSFFVYNNPNVSNAYDCGGSSHGTHTMGTILGMDPATNDTIGVAPEARWIAAPSICSGFGTSARIATFQWAMDPDGNPSTTSDMPDAICNSWYDPNTTNECNSLYRTTFDAVEAAGIAIVFSAGNSGSGASTITMPKNINNDTVSVFCVGATEINPPYNIAGFSSRGPSTCNAVGSLLIKPEVAAPGVGVRSAVAGGGYSNYSGTSMAAPHVTGAILLLKEAFPNLTGRQIKMALYMSATDMGAPGEDNDYGMGLINVPAAYNYLINQGHVPASYALDAGVDGVVAPSANTCDTDIAAEVDIYNFGSSMITSLTIEYRYASNAGFATMNWTGTLMPGQTTTVTLPNVTLTPGDYTLEVVVSNPNSSPDERPFDNCIFYDFKIQSGADVNTPVSLTCPGPATLSVTSPPLNTVIEWYDAPTGGNLIGTGNNYQVNAAASSNYWADITYNRFTAKPDNSGGGGNFNNDERYLYFDAYVPFTLKTVVVYAGSAGNRTIELRNSAGTVLQSTTVNIPSGQQTVTLNFNVPTGTDHILAVNGTVNLYRNNAGVSYPYEIPNVLSITRSNATTATQFYYFFYQWSVEYNSPCGREMVEVDVQNAGSISSFVYNAPVSPIVGDTIYFADQSAPTPNSWLWDFGDGNTSTLQNPKHVYAASGTYNVTLTVDGGSACSSDFSDNVEISPAVGITEANGTRLEVYPNPTAGRVNVRLVRTETGPVSFLLYNAVGAKLVDLEMDGGEELYAPLDLTALAAGTYFLHVRSGETQLVHRINRK